MKTREARYLPEGPRPSVMPSAEVIGAGLWSGDRRALARVMSWIEAGDYRADQAIEALSPNGSKVTVSARRSAARDARHTPRNPPDNPPSRAARDAAASRGR